MRKELILKAKDFKPSRIDFEVLGAFNPSVIKYGNETIMIVRVAEKVISNNQDSLIVPYFTDKNQISIKEIPKQSSEYDYSDSRIVRNKTTSYLTSVSHFRVGKSSCGVKFIFDEETFIFPDNVYEEYGIEDPRITRIGEDYFITYTAISGYGINVGLMKTRDFKHFERLGNIFHADNKDVVIFPEMINGKYYALHRPSLSHFGGLDIWIAESNDLIGWGNHRIIKEAVPSYTESARIGAGAVPIRTDKGWLAIYHSADQHHRYHLTAMLLDLENPTKVLAKSIKPLLEPTEIFERSGFLNDVVFTCGLVENGNDEILLYYGVCDENIALAHITIEEIYKNMGVT